MINSDTLAKVSQHFAYKRMTFDVKDYQFILNRETVRTRLIDFLSKDYYQRKKLVDDGFVGVCYTFRINYSDGKDKNHRSVAFFAPNLNLMVDQAFFLRILSHIEKLRHEKKKSFKQRRFLNYVDLIDAKPQYYRLDESLTEGKRVYLQYIEIIPLLNPNLQIGLNYVLYAPLMTKELLYIPEKLIQE